MMVYVVNEYLPGGWLEFLTKVKLENESEFDAEREKERLDAEDLNLWDN